MFRKKVASITKSPHLKWRSHEPSRLETFSDAVFAFALTLIIVSIEVPKSFDELYETMKGSISFAICFAVLFQLWNAQNIFFRKYGLKDSYTTTLNGFLLFVVLIYAYPLKFLTMLLFGKSTYLHEGHEVPMIHSGQTSTLMLIYGAGYVVIYAIFFLMYRNVIKHAAQIELTPKEMYTTKTEMYINLASTGIGLIAMAFAVILPSRLSGLSGFLYFLIPVSYSLIYGIRGKRSRLNFGATED